MFQSVSIVRFHHLFVIQTLLGFHKQCNIWYLRLKHKLALLLNSHLRRSLTTSASNRRPQSQSSKQDYEAACYYYSGGNGGGDSFVRDHGGYQQTFGRQAGEFFGQFASDLNRALINDATASGRNSSLSIPMHMLLLPFIVHQPRVVSPPPEPIGIRQATTTNSDGHNSIKYGHEIYSSPPNNLRHLANDGAQRCSFMLDGDRGSSGPAAAAAAAAQRSRGSLALDYNLAGRTTAKSAAKSTWSLSSSNNLFATRSGGGGSNSASLALRNPLICFPSTSNEIGHVKYM